MKIFETVDSIHNTLIRHHEKGEIIGFIPTMGALHEGHLSLIEKSQTENDITVASIFVNPIQFNNPHDLDKYPRDLARDEKMLQNVGCDYLFAPDVEEIYPGGKKEDINLDFGRLDRVLEAKFRPGHFKGVAIVVKRLFDIISPDRAYFGKKDYQQLLIIEKMVHDLQLPVKIVACPIVREPDGLAMSSRNMRLSIRERMVAPQISEVLFLMKNEASRLSVSELKKLGTRKLESNPLFRVEYLEIVDKRTLAMISDNDDMSYGMVCAAVYLGDVRLIDNLELF